MLEPVFFALRARRPDLVERFGWLYLLLAAEALYDWVLRIPFRERPDWRIPTPYVALCVSSSYGFVVMTWQESAAPGAVVLVLTVAQLAANAMTHTSPTDTAR